ncbi:MAG TPA: dipeptide epimerase [Chitinophagaceae bacterium]|nr:dipeptide epimerase [Chitinophagaceae bacterium]
MKITAVKAYIKNLALQRPYAIARDTVYAVESVFFEITLANGITGIGAANPDPDVVGEAPTDTLRHLQADSVQQLAGKDIRYFLALINHYRQQFAGLPGTMACIDIALHDAFAQYLGIAVVDFYGRQHQRMLTSVTIGIKDVAGTLEEAAAYQALGFRVLKIKTGIHPAEDAERIIKLRERYGQYFTLRVDANTGYNMHDLQQFLQATQQLAIELIEQPLPPAADAALLQLPAAQRTILAADESLKDSTTALQLAQDKRYGIFNIKLMKCGGIAGAREITGIAGAAGIALFWGCNDESIAGITAALHAAFTCAHTRYIDLDGSLDLAEDMVSGGFTIENGYMSLVDKPGLGLSRR